MIVYAQFVGIGCIKYLAITFAPVTAIKGPNGSGKSWLIKTLMGDLPADINDGVLTLNCQVQGKSTHQEISGPSINKTLQYLTQNQILNLKLDSLRQENILETETQLSPSGDNLTNVFAALPRKHQALISEQLSLIFPSIQDVDIQPTSAGRHKIIFQDTYSGIWVSSRNVFDGIVLMLAFLIIPYQQSRPQVLFVEHPERNLHKFSFAVLLKLFHDLSEGKLGDPIQVIFSTHASIPDDLADRPKTIALSLDSNGNTIHTPECED